MDDLNVKISSYTSNVIPSSQNTIKSFSLININNICNIDKDNNILDDKKNNSCCNKNANENKIKLIIGNHPLMPIKAIEKIAYCNLVDQHFKSEDYYNAKVIDEIIHNDKSHIVAEFKDYLIKGDISEFLQQYYSKKESLFLLPKIYEYYINCSVIFPNYVVLPESKYIYNSIQKKQRVIDIQQEQEDKEENVKNGLIEQEKQPTIFNSQVIDSLLNQTDTSGIKRYFGISIGKSGDEPEMMKIVNDIENTEKNIDIYIKNKKNKINVCKLKKDKKNNIFRCLNNITLNQDGYIQKYHNIFHNKKKSKTFFERKNNKYKNNLKYNFKQITDNNYNIYNKIRNNYSSQIESFNNQMKKIFDIKGKELTIRAKKNSKEKDNEKISSKNNSQIHSSLKYMNSKEKSNNYNYKYNENISENYSINRNIIKNIKKGKNNKEILNRNKIILNFDKSIKNNFHNPFRNLTQSINTMKSYKTKSKNKNKSKGNQTTRNKYENISTYINANKNNISKNFQSIDCTKNYNKINNHLKNNLINTFLLNGTNQKKQKKKYKNILIQKDNKESFINSIFIKEIKNKENTINNEKIKKENYDKDNDTNNNNLIINNNQKSLESNDNNNNFFQNKINEKSNSQNNKKNESSNSYNNNNNKFWSTKTLYINSYRDKPKYSISNINAMIHKKQNSMSKIPISFPENKILINNKINYNRNLREDSNKKKIKEKINNYLDDYYSKEINNCNSIQIKNNNQDNSNINNNYRKNINKNDAIPFNNVKEKTKGKKKSNKIRNSIFNFEKNLSKKLSEKNVNIFEIFKPKSLSKNNKSKKVSSHSNKSGNLKMNEYGLLSARETNRHHNNSEMIELLTNKIQKMKKSIKETSDKDSYSISTIFKKKRMPTGREFKIQKKKKNEEFTEKKTRNKKNNSNDIETTNSNNDINGNIINTIINNILQINLLNTNKNNLEYDKLIKTFQKLKKPTNNVIGTNNNNVSNYNNSINNNVGNKKETKKTIKHEKCKSINNNNYDNHFNIEVNNIDIQSKKSVNNVNNQIQNNNIKNVNINFNNFTNNYNYKINQINNNNVNKMNNGNMNFNNSNLNKGKSNSLKMITNKPVNKNEIHLKGIPINGFEKIVNKKNNTRNYNIPMSYTDRIKQNNTYSTSIINNNGNSNRYKNIQNINNRVYK